MALRKTSPIEIKVVNGTVTITYANYAPVSTTIIDPTGNWKAPKTLQVRYTGNGTGGYTQMVAIQNFKFYKDVANAPVAPINQAPIANAGADLTVTLPATTANLSGAGTDSDGSISTYSWIKISGPSATITSANAAYTQLNNLVQGIYQFELTATDNSGAIGKDTVQVTVNAATAGNLLPAVNPANPVNGLDYKYYEGTWSVLPNYSALSPVKTVLHPILT
jgi:hypothetical protein